MPYSNWCDSIDSITGGNWPCKAFSNLYMYHR